MDIFNNHIGDLLWWIKKYYFHPRRVFICDIASRFPALGLLKRGEKMGEGNVLWIKVGEILCVFRGEGCGHLVNSDSMFFK